LVFYPVSLATALSLLSNKVGIAQYHLTNKAQALIQELCQCEATAKADPETAEVCMVLHRRGTSALSG